MAGKELISERHVLEAAAQGRSTLSVAEGALITPLARDTARDKGIEITTTASASCGCEDEATEPKSVRTVAIGSDHGGFAYKVTLLDHLRKSGFEVLDLGTTSEASVDYPDFAYAVARAVAVGKAGAGIMIDGAGIGSAMVCNKVPGIRAACAYNEFTAWNARAHNEANVLTLGSRTLGIEVCKRVVDVFLATPFEGGRHKGRVDKIADVEKRFAPGRSY